MLEIVLNRAYQDGAMIGVQGNHDLALLHPVERTYAKTLAPRRQATWVLGRHALRFALAAVGVQAVGPLLHTHRGAPRLPPQILGSLSHKDDMAVAWIKAYCSNVQVGIDIEYVYPERLAIANKVLTPSERRQGLDWPAVLNVFSLKEAIYKALDPFMERYVGFQEVSVALDADGSAKAVFTKPFHITGQVWQECIAGRDVVLSTATVKRVSTDRDLEHE